MTIGSTLSIRYDCVLLHIAQLLASSANTVIVPLFSIHKISQTTGFAYGSVVSHPAHIHVHNTHDVHHGDRVIFVRSHEEGVEIVTVELVIVVLLSVVGAFITTFGGKNTVVCDEFHAVSYTITVIHWGELSGSKISERGPVASVIVVGVQVHGHPSSAGYIISKRSTPTLSRAENETTVGLFTVFGSLTSTVIDGALGATVSIIYHGSH